MIKIKTYQLVVKLVKDNETDDLIPIVSLPCKLEEMEESINWNSVEDEI